MINQNTEQLKTILDTLKTLQQAKTETFFSPTASFNTQTINTLSTQSFETLAEAVNLDTIITPSTLSETMSILAQSPNTEIQTIAQETLSNMPIITEFLASQPMQALASDAIHTGVALIGAAVLATTAAPAAAEAASSIITPGLSETLTAATTTAAIEIASSTTLQQLPEIA
jgi:xanthine dehydrogenase iron-sulfur cluster and FAD-binding subunit A